jgi:hypothetical protein
MKGGMLMTSNTRMQAHEFHTTFRAHLQALAPEPTAAADGQRTQRL